jgi:biopolymer transport protein ExbB
VGRKFLAWLIALLAITTPAFAQTSGGWWNKDWPYRRPVTVDTSPTGGNISGAIGRTVLLVRLHDGNFTADLRVIDADGKTPLPFHIERYDATNSIAALWVSVPNLNGGEKRQLWLYYGNKNASADGNVAQTYDPDTIAAYHFSEAAGKPAGDLTANANNAQNAVPAIDENGVIARAARFQGQGELVIPATPSLAMPAGAPLTLSAWVKADQPAGEQAIFTRGPLTVGIADGVPFALVGTQRIQAAAALKPGEWTQLGLVADGQNLRLYASGVEAAAAAGVLPALDGPITLGGAAGRPFTGELDEVRLSKTARPAAMLLASAQAEGPSNKIVAVAGTAERQSSGGGTFFYVLGKVELIDAFIIGLCLFILVLAVIVMISKSNYINRSVRANRVFVRRFRSLHEHLVSMKQVEGVSPRELAAIERSPLGRIYETGIEELEVRREARGRRPLAGESVEAMRAAVDAVVVEENQKLDRWLVLLTIAISGGPFIGLLGTVLGVMNTFAGVAQAGDVNVNAIAPGIAAALMATIAGLACAIPSLFGYNYLNSRISALSDEMRVFVDRLITRLAEMQIEDAPPPVLQAAE